MRADMERWASAFDELKVTVEEIIDAGDQVVVAAHHQGRGRASGVDVDTRFYEVDRFAKASSRAWMSTPSMPRPSKP
jgi:ketosteroid isomerase-like protein